MSETKKCAVCGGPLDDRGPGFELYCEACGCARDEAPTPTSTLVKRGAEAETLLDLPALRALAREAIADHAAASPGPWVYDREPNHRDTGSWHYAIRTRDTPPAHPHSPRFIAWMCGGLGEALARHRVEHVRTDPETEADCRLITRARSREPALAKAVEQLADALEAKSPPKALPESGLHKHELPFCGRYYGAVNVDGYDHEPLFLFDEEAEAQAELDRRHALDGDHDEYLSDDWQILSFDVEGIFWNSYDENPRPAPEHSRLWEMNGEVERLTKQRDEARERATDAGTALGLAKNQVEGLGQQNRELHQGIAKAKQKARILEDGAADAQEAIARLTRERDEARAEVEQLKAENAANEAALLEMAQRAQTAIGETLEARSEAERMQPVVEAVAEVLAERERQDAKWGGPAHDDEHVPADWLEYIAEKTASVTIRLRFATMGGDYPRDERRRVDHERLIQPEDLALYRKRLVQIEALALAARQSLDRKAKASS